MSSRSWTLLKVLGYPSSSIPFGHTKQFLIRNGGLSVVSSHGYCGCTVSSFSRYVGRPRDNYSWGKLFSHSDSTCTPPPPLSRLSPSIILLSSKRNFAGRPSPSYHSGSGPMDEKMKNERVKSTLYYLAALGVVVLGASYAAVPLYRIFCAQTGFGGTTQTHEKDVDLSNMKKVENREITIKFFADKSSSMQWNFKPQQNEIIVRPGETALAFYRAENRTPLPVDGISTYNVIPFEAGQYFNKIQCFCFEEQRLNPGETVELPVFFYIDPEFVKDPKMQNVKLISLSYTFFESKEMPDFNFNLGNWSPHDRGGGGRIVNPNKKGNDPSSSSSPLVNPNANQVNIAA